MNLAYSDRWLDVHQGDCRAVLPTLPDASIDAVITSPPYWQLRSYLAHDAPEKSAEIGQEATFAEWVEVMASICDELRRILTPRGSLWLVLGDRFVAYGGENTFGDRAGDTAYRRKVPGWRVRPSAFPPGLRKKSLLLAPYRLAIELEERGWILRDRIVWWKTNGIPESVGDRFHVRDEVILRFTPERFAHFDANAVREPYSQASLERNRAGRAPTFAGRKNAPPGQPARSPKIWTGDDADAHRVAFLGQGRIRSDGKNPGNVWAMPTASRAGNRFDHYAMFPPELVRRPILSTVPKGGVVLDPFAGTGTTAEVANRLMRRAVLIELDPASIEAIRIRCSRRPIVEVPA